ncbi:LytTR family DNA-binding domain-containing protein [Persicobacter sp. CCB-QB2]|uniref:LytR/AlgR family response regulator transcription factor n=1 Tax=Persicobacter sp. CCB-QB2 TaxID=1561025 RepID=UPI00209FFB95|nr:LytTR family DNA-binding domain-containing protein [Persicobacter sp. CCB-QB2]
MEMEKIKCLIVDDEQLARTLLTDYVKKMPELELVDCCANPLDAIEVLKAREVDLLLLDIQMPDLTGFEMLNTLADPPLVIFTTAYSDYAIKGYEVKAVDYLLKPFSLTRFMQAVAKAKEQIELRRKAANSNAEEEAYLMVKEDYRYHRIKVKDIAYVEGMREYVRYHTPEKKVMALASLTKLESELPAADFMRVHKSYIVNFQFVTGLEGNQLKVLDQYLPIGKTHKDRVLKRLGVG